MPRWINAQERIPTYEEYTYGYVIVAFEDGCVRNGYYSNERKEWAFQESHGEVLYWMPFPEHPEKEAIKK